jgi:hypothetical protein
VLQIENTTSLRLTLPLSVSPRPLKIFGLFLGDHAEPHDINFAGAHCKCMVDIVIVLCVRLNKFVLVNKGQNARQVPEPFHAKAGLVRALFCQRLISRRPIAGASTSSSQAMRLSVFVFFSSFSCSNLFSFFLENEL